ncbi:MAG: hydrogenase maturation protease [Deltaproteobacteria bacterium]|nr:MAG: hydrogenase maturation protease [Deltaproteobacteria bacterium]
MIVIGLGNILLCDEGIGVHVVNALRERELPDGVELVDGGVAGFTLLNMLEGETRAVIVDAVSAPLPPGTVVRLDPKEVGKSKEEKYSLHDFSLRDVLDLMNLRGTTPEMLILGIVPGDIHTYKIGLSPELEEKFEDIVEKVRKEIEKYARQERST